MRKIIVLCLSLIVACSAILYANEITGEDILNKVEESMGGETSHLKLTMKIYNSKGDCRERSMEIYRKDGSKDKSLIKFLAPATVKGTGFLALEENDNTNMYLYMPALGSERRIAGSQRNSSFVGSDFSYNDLAIIGGGNYSSDYSSKIIEYKDEVYKLEMIPSDEDIDYQYVYMWVNSDKWYPVKIEIFNSSGELAKIMDTSSINEEDGYLTFEEIVMRDVKEGSKTEIILSDVSYDIELDDNLFTVRNLKR